MRSASACLFGSVMLEVIEDCYSVQLGDVMLVYCQGRRNTASANWLSLALADRLH